ncbi:hypothetical protein GCM10023220_28000 [Streptomyces ziwulingensis]|uniref:Transposase IS4-like domain-containing protein n=1 Tax=Streptomyces ziwulingensis TaxID=1045501 RepID=A0ABP9BSF1_9ACTN
MTSVWGGVRGVGCGHHLRTGQRLRLAPTTAWLRHIEVDRSPPVPDPVESRRPGAVARGHRGRYFKPQRLHADKAYDRADLRKWLRGKRIGVRIARKGIEPSERLGRRRWAIERTVSWLSGYRRLSPRYERDPRNYLAFLGLAAALCCYKRLVRLTT